MRQWKRKKKEPSTFFFTGRGTSSYRMLVPICADGIEQLIKEELKDCFDYAEDLSLKEACLKLMEYYGMQEDYLPMRKKMEALKNDKPKRRKHG